MTASAPIIELKGVTKSYGIGTPVETEVLHGIDGYQQGRVRGADRAFRLRQKQMLNIIGLLERMTSGDHRLLGDSVGALDDAAITGRRGDTLGFVFQFHHLLPAFSAVENVMLPAG